MLSLNRRQIYSEVDSIISMLSVVNQNKIPYALREFIKNNKDINYIKEFDINIPIAEQNINPESLALFAFLNQKYICSTQEEKDKLNKIYEENSKKYSDELFERFNNLNKRSTEKEKVEDNMDTSLVEHKKESKLNVLIKKILSLFKFGKK